MDIRTIPPSNNMDALRLAFASLVVIFHLYAVPLDPVTPLAPYATFIADWSIRGFFIISGFLIFQSFEQSSSLGSYAVKRIRRIYPAYFAVVVFWSLAGALLTTWSAAEYFGVEWLKYLINNLLFLNYRHPDLPGVFAGNSINAVNGSLWTIKIEVMFYMIVPAAVWLFRFVRKDILLASIYVMSVAFFWYFNHLAAVTGNGVYSLYAKQLPGQMCYFVSGAAIYYYFGWFSARVRRLVPVTLLVLLASVVADVDVLVPACVGILVMMIAFGPYLGNAGRYGDFSYGVYIWHYPIIQTLVVLGVFHSNAALAAGAAVLLAMLSAYVSWRIVERPFLRRHSHYRLVEGSETAAAMAAE